MADSGITHRQQTDPDEKGCKLLSVLTVQVIQGGANSGGCNDRQSAQDT